MPAIPHLKPKVVNSTPVIANIFDLNERGDQEIVNLLSECEAHIRSNQIEIAKRELEKLKLHFGKDDPYVNFLDILLTSKQ